MSDVVYPLIVSIKYYVGITWTYQGEKVNLFSIRKLI